MFAFSSRFLENSDGAVGLFEAVFLRVEVRSILLVFNSRRAEAAKTFVVSLVVPPPPFLSESGAA